MALSRKTRRFIVAGLILLFLVIAPLLIFYARGYRYDFADKTVEQVGMIMVSFDPTTATARVNGEVANFDITALGYDRFPNLVPGQYHTEVSQDGYHTWSKNLEVVPEVVTWTRYVTLFLSDPAPQNLINLDKITAQDFSPDRQWVCAAGANQDQPVINIYSLENEQAETLALADIVPRLKSTQLNITDVSFAPDSNHLLLTIEDKKNNKQFVVFSRELSSEEPPVILNDIINQIEEAHWHPDNSAILYTMRGQELFRMAPYSGQEPKRLASQVLGFDANIAGLFFIRPREDQVRTEPQATLGRMELDGSSPEILSEDIELTDSYEIKTSAAKRLAVLTDTGHLYTILPETEKTERIAVDASRMEWSLDNDEEDSTDELLLYSNDHEIYTYDPLIQNSEVITRYTEIIENAFWYTGNYKYIVFTVGGRIKIIELDERDHRNCADIWQTGDTETISQDSGYLDSQQEFLYFTIDTEKDGFIRSFHIRE